MMIVKKIPAVIFSFRFIFLILLCLFWIQGMVFLDTDFGWHVRVGEYILHYGFPYREPFSYAMPSYPFVSHEWSIDILIFKLYQLGGFILLSFVFAVTALFSLTLQLHKAGKKISKWDILPFLLACSILFYFFSLRPHVFGWLLFALFLRVTVYSGKKNLPAFLPLLFVLWANIHGSFFAGFAVLGLSFLYDLISQKSIPVRNGIISLLCIIATLLNPYREGLWIELWSILSDPKLHWQILEWMPGITVISITMWFFIILSSIFIFRYRNKFMKKELLLYLFFLASCAGSARYVPVFAIFALPLAIRSMQFFRKEISGSSLSAKRLEIAYPYFAAIVFLAASIQILVDMKSSTILSEANAYPVQAVHFLKTNTPRGQVFTLYEWGGYLLWKWPERKEFIDGRMTSWKLANPGPHESNDAFDEYRTIIDGKSDIARISKKYTITDFVLLRSVNKDNQEQKTAYTALQKQLLQKGWKVVYKDKRSIIYRM